MTRLEFHPAAEEFPLLNQDRIEQLAEDIKANGQREPIRVHRHQIVDGRNRYLACQRVGIEPRIEVLPEEIDPYAYVWSLNGERRDLTQDQRYLIWKSCTEKSEAWQAQRRQFAEEANRSRSQLQKDRPRSEQRPSTSCGRSFPAPRGQGSALKATASCTNRGTVERMDRLVRQRPDLAEQVRAGGISGYEAMRQIDKPHVAHNTGDSEWYTPSSYIEAARQVMGGIDLDVASCDVANQVVGAAAYFTAIDDGLGKPWSGRVWMNPPYAQPLVQRFCGKLAAHVQAGDVPQAVVLVNNATETRWFQTLLAVASAVCFPAGRVRFWHPEKTAAPLQGQAVLYCGPSPQAFVDAFAAFGRACYVVR